MEDMYLIVGLGNPGSDYARTRHNAGFLAVEYLAGKTGAAWEYDARFDARLGRGEVGSGEEKKRLLLCEPQTYMNASGQAVGAVIRYFKIPIDRVMIVVDDADLPLGHIRMRPGGSSGGHHGLESVEHHLGTKQYPRLRIGIGRDPAAGRRITRFVLGRFAPEELRLLNAVLERAAAQVACWVQHGISKAMSEYNGAVQAPLAKES